jgi:hypothetical protein
LGVSRCAGRDLGLIFCDRKAVSFFNNLEEVVKNLSVGADAFVMSVLAATGGL